MAKSATQLSVAKNEDVAETVAATIFDLISAATPATARDASAFRMVRKHVNELLEMHDALDPNEVLRSQVSLKVAENGGHRYRDLDGNPRPEHAEV